MDEMHNILIIIAIVGDTTRLTVYQCEMKELAVETSRHGIRELFVMGSGTF